ncbi:MAG: carbohydrate-binding protein, partial [Gemmatimonadetes bacterium]|nr:carbohydrate-binding protein [Gemmatimonadota bacterium]
PQAPFDQDFHLLLNSAIGGNYTGCTSSSCITASLPQEFLIDYVRVYEDIPNTLPTVAITSPTAGSTVPAGNITIDATASDPDGTIATVEFYDGATLLGEDTSAPYSFTWNSVSDGCYDIVVRALDDLGGTASDTVDVTVGLGCGQLPYPGTPFLFPALIQAEDYDLGGEGVAYHDIDSGNNGNQYRTAEGVDIEACTDIGGGYNIGWLNPGEWIEYTVDVPVPGTYGLQARVASQSTGGSFHLEFDGTDQTGSVAVPVTAGWQTWVTVTMNATLNAGVQTLRFVPETGGFNVNHFTVATVPTGVTPGLAAGGTALHASYPNPFNPRTTIRYSLQSSTVVDLTVYDVAGRQVRSLVSRAVAAGPQEAVWDGRDSAGRAVAGGVYFARLRAGDYSRTIRMVLER